MWGDVIMCMFLQFLIINMKNQFYAHNFYTFEDPLYCYYCIFVNSVPCK